MRGMRISDYCKVAAMSTLLQFSSRLPGFNSTRFSYRSFSLGLAHRHNFSTGKVVLPKRAVGGGALSSKKVQRWTDDEVERLRESVKLFPSRNQWQKISDHLGSGRSKLQCYNKWMYLVYTENHEEWSEEEATELRKFVAEFTTKKEEIDWSLIGAKLGRTERECMDEWKESEKPAGAVRVRTRGPWVTWADEQVSRLVEAVRPFQGRRISWDGVVEQVGGGLTLQVCQRKWFKSFGYVETRPNSTAKWTDADVARLRELVQQHSATQLKNSDTQSIDWVAIAKELGRWPSQCESKYHTIRAAEERAQGKKKSLFTLEEDARILHLVEQYGDKQKGMWRALREEFGGRDVRARWRLLRGGTQSRLVWTEEMDDALLAAHRDVHSNSIAPSRGDTALVVSRMHAQGWPLTTRQCFHRYYRVIQPRLEGVAISVRWTDEQVAALVKLHDKGASWQEISKQLRISPSVCRRKFDAERNKTLKQGPFTTQEDALISQRVKEWGDPKVKRGLWPKLQKELGRPAEQVRHRWFRTLLHKIVE